MSNIRLYKVRLDDAMCYLRRMVLWVTGRDLLEPKPNLPKGFFDTHYEASFTLSSVPTPRWDVRFSADAHLHIYLQTGPNVVHRWAQRFAFGIRWHMLPPNM